MAFSYAQDNDAFKDIEDLRLRNQRIQQDILNQKRNNARIAAAQQFAMWQGNPNAFGGDIPTGDFYALGAYGRTAPFSGAPSVSQAMTGLKESGGLALPKRKALYRTDENGNPVRLTDEEIAIRNNASKDLQKQAASDAATPANGGSWYDFLKNPQNTPYEQKQMRNHEIMRDAAIGSMLMKPIFNPDTDISEGMMRMAGQQQGMAQGAMDNYLKRQGMAADMYNSATKLATNYAAQSLQSQIQAQQELSAAENYEREAAIRAEQAEKLFGKNSPAYIAVVKSKDVAKQQELANQYDAMMRDAKYLESEAQKRKERSEQFIGKAKAFGDGAKKISQDWELGLNFDGLGGITTIGKNGTQVGGFAKQGEIGANVGGSFVQFPNTGAAPAGTPSTGVSPQSATEVPPSAENVPTGAENAPTGEPEKPVYTFNDGKLNKVDGNVKKVGSDDPIMKRIARLSNGNRDVDIARWKAAGSRVDLDTGIQAAADKNAWLTEVQAVANDIVSKPENFAKYKDFVYKVIEGGDRFGNASNILMNSTMNIPKFKGLRNYETDIMTYGGENSREELQDYYSILKEGGALTGAEVKNFEKLLSSPMFSWTNYQGKSMPLLKNNGLKLKAVEARNPDGSIVKDEKGNTMYFINLDDSFK
jgi:hypothetical protein